MSSRSRSTTTTNLLFSASYSGVKNKGDYTQSQEPRPTYSVVSPVRRTVRSACNGVCNRCPEDRCQFPVYCYANPLELTLATFGEAEREEDSQLGVALRRARTALAEGSLEHAEAALERAFECRIIGVRP